MDQGFVDLRQNRDAERAGDHFWPTFTDIMTVIVMVFLLASIVLVVRNWQLVSSRRTRRWRNSSPCCACS